MTLTLGEAAGPQAGNSTPAEGLAPSTGAAAPGLTAGGSQPRPAHRADPAPEGTCVFVKLRKENEEGLVRWPLDPTY